jgi:hypothetical protein
MAFGGFRLGSILWRAGVLLLALLAHSFAADFPAQVYLPSAPPVAPLLTDLPLVTQITQDGITWSFTTPQRVGRFVNGDYYVVGPVVILDIQPSPTLLNGRNGSMLNIIPNAQRSGFDDRLEAGRYDATLRVYPPIVLTPGNKLISSRSAGETFLKSVMRPADTSVSPVASVSILTCVDAPLPPDTFRPSYARGSTNLYFARNLRRELLPRLAPSAHVPPLSEFEGYLRRPWIDSVFFSFDVPSEYMAGYGRENAYVMSFAGLLLTLDFTDAQKEPLLVYMTQYGIDLYGLVEQGHTGWEGFGGHGSGRKFPMLLAGLLLNETKMTRTAANFGEDMQTIWVTETPPAGTFTRTWHSLPQTVAYAGHRGLNGEASAPGWGPYEHLSPPNWKSTIGETYRRCCTSACWVGEALAARLIPSVRTAWNHPQFFAYVDRWMSVPDDPADLQAIKNATGLDFFDSDFRQGQASGILRGGGYTAPHYAFVDEMWAAYRKLTRIGMIDYPAGGPLSFTVENAIPNRTNYVQFTTDLSNPNWINAGTNVTSSDTFLFIDNQVNNSARFYRVVTP